LNFSKHKNGRTHVLEGEVEALQKRLGFMESARCRSKKLQG
jgi:hypothetical protein